MTTDHWPLTTDYDLLFAMQLSSVASLSNIMVLPKDQEDKDQRRWQV